MGMTTRDTDWDGVRLHVVTGKGGTGKTTVAAALALALASAGRRVLLIEVEGRQGLARLFDCPPLPYEERKVALGLGAQGTGQGGDVYALAVDPEGALLDYLEMFYNLRRTGKALNRLGVMDFATTIAPGLSDVLVTGKATEAARRRVQAAAATPRVPRRRDGRPADGPDRPVPQRQHRGLRAGQGGPDQDARGHGSQGDQVAADGGALRHHPGGDAGTGDPGRHRRVARAHRGRHPHRRHHRKHGQPGHPERAPTWRRPPAVPWTSANSPSASRPPGSARITGSPPTS